MPFERIYLLYVQKAERKGRTGQEVDEIISWLTGYETGGWDKDADVRTFFEKAPAYNPRADLITGVICGVRVEDVEDPLMKKVRQLDKLIDELAKGKAMEKILR